MIIPRHVLGNAENAPANEKIVLAAVGIGKMMYASHLPHFTLLEYYCAYWNYEDNMDFTEKLVKDLLTKVKGSLQIEYEGTKIDLDGTWPRTSFRDLIRNDRSYSQSASSSHRLNIQRRFHR